MTDPWPEVEARLKEAATKCDRLAKRHAEKLRIFEAAPMMANRKAACEGAAALRDDYLEQAADLRAALARIEALTARQAWLPIESAPKDGTPVDGWAGNSEFPHRLPDMEWRKPSDSEFWTHGSDEPAEQEQTIGLEPRWFDIFGPITWLEQPTHWRPRPAPPSLSRIEAVGERAWRPISELQYRGQKIIAQGAAVGCVALHANPEWKPEAERVFETWIEYPAPPPSLAPKEPE